MCPGDFGFFTQCHISKALNTPYDLCQVCLIVFLLFCVCVAQQI